MALTATEQEILNAIGRFREASLGQIARSVMISPGYADYLCKYVAKKGYLELTPRKTYRLTLKGKKLLISDLGLIWDKETIKTMAGELAKELGRTLPMRGLKEIAPLPAQKTPEIKIKEAFISPIEDVKLEYDFGKGPKQARTPSKGVEKTIKLLKKFKKK